MPHLTLCNRYWRISTDELPIPLASGTILRILRAVMLAVSLNLDLVQQEGQCNYDLITYFSVSLVLCLLLSLTAMMNIRIGMEGTIADSKRREDKMRPYLICHGILLVLEALCACMGLAVLISRSGKLTDCGDEVSDAVQILLTIVVIFQLMNAGLLSCCCLTTYVRQVDDKTISSMQEGKEAESVWLLRFKNLFSCVRFYSCTVCGGSNFDEQDLESVSKLFTLFFHHDGFLDLVPGDVFAGLLLVRLQQRSMLKEQMQSTSSDEVEIENQISPNNISIEEALPIEPLSPPKNALLHQTVESTSAKGIPSRSTRRGTEWMEASDFLEGKERSIYANRAKLGKRQLLPENQKDHDLVADIEHYVPYALSSYSIFLAVMHPCTCGCRICSSCVSSIWKQNTEYVDGDSCYVHRSAAAHSSRKRSGDLVYGNFENTVLLSPYCIFHDYERDEVILSIRGTMSIEDAVLDLTLDPVDASVVFKQHGIECHEGTYCHGGFLKSAVYMLEHIDQEGSLKKLIDKEGVNRKLVVVGHSLGGGLAALLTILLRNRYPNTRGMCYAPPGVTIDQVAAHDSREYITSIVYGEDCISCLNYHALTHLRERVLDSLSRAKVNKNYILQSLYKDFELENLLYDPEEIPSNHGDFVDTINKFKTQVHGKLKKDKRPQLTLPGRIIHFVIDDRSTGCGTGTPLSLPYEIHQDAFLELPITEHILQDHMISNYYRGLVDYCTHWKS